MKPCVHASLVEPAFDGRLGARQQESMDRHVSTCDACRRELEALRDARAVLRALPSEVTPLEHQRARLALLAASVVPAKRKKAKRLTVTLLAAAALLVPLIVWGASRRLTTTTVVDDPVETSFPVPLPEPPPPKPRFVPPIEPAAPKEKPAPTTSAVTTTRSSASKDFASAMDAVSRGDFGAGAALLGRFVEANPNDPRAEEALYVEAIALERAGRKSEARTVARRYLSTYPNGSHAAHAEQIAAE